MAVLASAALFSSYCYQSCVAYLCYFFYLVSVFCLLLLLWLVVLVVVMVVVAARTLQFLHAGEQEESIRDMSHQSVSAGRDGPLGTGMGFVRTPEGIPIQS